jgi:hypothetical protein
VVRVDRGKVEAERLGVTGLLCKRITCRRATLEHDTELHRPSTRHLTPATSSALKPMAKDYRAGDRNRQGQPTAKRR